jgi:hypothetical protein
MVLPLVCLRAACWVAHDCCSGRDVFGDDCSGGDHGAGSDCYSGEYDCPGSDAGAGFNGGFDHFPVAGGAGFPIVGEAGVWSDEDFVTDFDAAWDECEWFNFAAVADFDAPLNFYECADFAVAADLAFDEVDVVADDGARAYVAVLDDGVGGAEVHVGIRGQ